MKRLTPAIQDYLRALLELSAIGEPVRTTAVAERLGVSKASVSQAMDVLKRVGYIAKEPYGPIRLTPKGRKTANEIKRRNLLIRTLLIEVLGVKEEIALHDACSIEHQISAETVRKIEGYLHRIALWPKPN
ncbi:MAG TPA: metal-dependent transcriptional regulator [Firmicutes bacterium]|nr:metal-dependent transcriptional regulator [Bacillota bacterium]